MDTKVSCTTTWSNGSIADGAIPVCATSFAVIATVVEKKIYFHVGGTNDCSSNEKGTLDRITHCL